MKSARRLSFAYKPSVNWPSYCQIYCCRVCEIAGLPIKIWVSQETAIPNIRSRNPIFWMIVPYMHYLECKKPASKHRSNQTVASLVKCVSPAHLIHWQGKGWEQKYSIFLYGFNYNEYPVSMLIHTVLQLNITTLVIYFHVARVVLHLILMFCDALT